MHYGVYIGGSDINLDSDPPASDMGISGPQSDLDIIKGRGD